MSSNYAQQVTYGDPIDQLPIDTENPSLEEAQIVDALFEKHRGTMEILVEEGKDSVFVGFLVIILSLPQVDGLIQKFIPSTVNSPYILLLIKGIAAAILFWILKHLYLSRREKSSFS